MCVMLAVTGIYVAIHLHKKAHLLVRLWQIVPKKVPIILFSYSQNFFLLFPNILDDLHDILDDL